MRGQVYTKEYIFSKTIKYLKFGCKDNYTMLNELVFETIESLIRLLIFSTLSKIISIKIWFSEFNEYDTFCL